MPFTLLAFFLTYFLDALRMACNASGNVLYVTLSSGPKSTPISCRRPPFAPTHTHTLIRSHPFSTVRFYTLPITFYKSISVILVRLIPFLRTLLFSSHFLFPLLPLASLVLLASPFFRFVHWCKCSVYFCWYF